MTYLDYYHTHWFFYDESMPLANFRLQYHLPHRYACLPLDRPAVAVTKAVKDASQRLSKLHDFPHTLTTVPWLPSFWNLSTFQNIWWRWSYNAHESCNVSSLLRCRRLVVLFGCITTAFRGELGTLKHEGDKSLELQILCWSLSQVFCLITTLWEFHHHSYMRVHR